jgi:hypothetical protein
MQDFGLTLRRSDRLSMNVALCLHISRLVDS